MTLTAPSPQDADDGPEAQDKMHFLGLVSHELRTPLHAILGFSEMLEQQIYGKLGAPEYLEFASEIKASGQKLLLMINELIAASGAQIGDDDTIDTHVDIARLIGDAVQAAKPLIDRKRQTIGLSASAAHVGLWADARTIRHMLGALIDNAAKFTPEGGVIEVDVAIDPDGDVMISVADDGPGFPEGAIAEMTAAFNQADGRLERQHEGMGVGLFVCQRLMRLNDGRLELTNRPEGGARVTMAFPKARSIDLQAEDDLTVMDEDEDEEASPHSAILELEHDGQTYYAFQNGQEFVLGRTDARAERTAAHLAVSDRRASRPHAQIVASDGAFYLVDESRRGSYVAADGAAPEFVHLSVSPPLVGSGIIALGDRPDAEGVATVRYRLRPVGSAE